jgi:hypothetical protein
MCFLKILYILLIIYNSGRPQFDDSGTAVIMTSLDKVERYKSLISGTQLIESCLHRHLVEHLNAEIQLQTIIDTPSAIKWLKTTFLYIRCQRNPTYYDLPHAGLPSARIVDSALEKWCHDAITQLQQNECVQLRGNRLQTLPLGASMSKYYVCFETISLLASNLPAKATPAMLLHLISRAGEFEQIRFQPGDKPVLKKLASRLRYPLPADANNRVTTIADKVYILLQCSLGDLPFQDAHVGALLEGEARRVIREAPRILSCVVEMFKLRADGIGLLRAVELLKCIKSQRWDDQNQFPQFIIRQLDKIGPVMAGQLIKAGYQTIQSMRQADPRRLEQILGRHTPFGNQLIEASSRLPQLKLEVMQYQENGVAEVELFVTIRLENGNNGRPLTTIRSSPVYIAFCCYRSDGLMLDFRRMPVAKLNTAGGRQFSIRARFNSPSHLAHCHLICENFIGLDREFTVTPNCETMVSCENSNIAKVLNDKKGADDANAATMASCENSNIAKALNDKSGADVSSKSARQKVQTQIYVKPNGSVRAAVPKQQLPHTPATSTITQHQQDQQFDYIEAIPPPPPIASVKSPQRVIILTPPRTASSKFFPASATVPAELNDSTLQSCNHKCKDKQACGHLCCKTGRVHRPRLALKRKRQSVPDKIEFDEILAASTPKSTIVGTQQSAENTSIDDLLAQLGETVDLQQMKQQQQQRSVPNVDNLTECTKKGMKHLANIKNKKRPFSKYKEQETPFRNQASGGRCSVIDACNESCFD